MLLAGNQATIADVAGNTYIADAPQDQLSLADYLNVRAWLALVEALAGFVPMPRTETGLHKVA